jgi:asparagine synthase (glutamine-hydrolysing)
MTDLIRHRGPDSEGFAVFSLINENYPYVYGGEDTPQELLSSPTFYRQPHPNTNYHLSFGHRRLSILDLSSSGHQPMSDAEGRFWIIYNGEVYNYLELKQELALLGHQFRSQSDTEVILMAYKQWGIDCTHRFNGMFSFLIFDTKTHTLFGARDRFGVKPLYYWISPEGFAAFASEIKQFTILPGWNPSVCGQTAYDFLNWGITNHAKETCFSDVYQLQGGHCFICFLTEKKNISISPQKWYSLPIRNYTGSFEEAGEQFTLLLKDAIKLRCRADVPIGSCLSGGLDSSSIVCLVHSILKEQKKNHSQITFSACSHYPQFDEKDYILQVVDQTKVLNHITYPELDNLFDKLDTIIWHQDEPFGSTSIFAQWEVFSLVKQHGVKVMLDGQGADEQLAGYSGFHSARLYDLAINLRFFTLWKELRKTRQLHNISFPVKLLLNQMLPQLFKQPIRRALKKSTIEASWLDNNILNASIRDPSQFFVPAKGALSKLSYAQITKTSVPMLLHFEDRDSMAHSIEARTPFLDYRLVEFLQSLPSDYKLADGMTKRVLRQGLRGTLPEGIRTRVSKLGFATPEEMWVRNNPQKFQSLIKESISFSQGILNQQAIQICNDMIFGRRPYTFFVWRLIVFGRWMKRFSVRIRK